MVRPMRLTASCLLLVALTTSLSAKGLEIGTQAPDFEATTVDGQPLTLESVKDADVVVLIFTCNSCPVAVAYEDRFIEFTRQMQDQNIAVIAINNHSGEDLEKMRQRKEEKGLNYTYAYEGTGDSARAYGAMVTPHCFVLNKDRKLVYKGAFDNEWNGEPTEHYVSSVVTSLLAGKEPEYHETKAVGCSIKLRQ